MGPLVSPHRPRRVPLSPAGPPWPPSRRWGAPLCLCSCSRQDCECSHVPDSGGGMGSSRMSHSFPPVFQLCEALRISRQAGVSPSESDQLLHFASNGQLCGGTKPQPHSSMVTRLFLGNSHRGSAGTAPLRGNWCGVARGAVERGPELFRDVSVFLLFSNQCPNK